MSKFRHTEARLSRREVSLALGPPPPFLPGTLRTDPRASPSRGSPFRPRTGVRSSPSPPGRQCPQLPEALWPLGETRAQSERPSGPWTPEAAQPTLPSQRLRPARLPACPASGLPRRGAAARQMLAPAPSPCRPDRPCLGLVCGRDVPFCPALGESDSVNARG